MPDSLEIEPGQPLAPTPDIPKPIVANINNANVEGKDLKFPKPDPEWHGYKVGELGAIHVGYVPGRVSPALYTAKNGVIEILAYFKDEEKAREALYFIDCLAQIFVKTSYD